MNRGLDGSAGGARRLPLRRWRRLLALPLLALPALASATAAHAAVAPGALTGFSVPAALDLSPLTATDAQSICLPHGGSNVCATIPIPFPLPLKPLLTGQATLTITGSHTAIVAPQTVHSTAAPGSGATIYVNGATGVDSPSCGASPAAACATISQGVTNAVDGDTVSIAAGTYNELVPLDKNLALVGAGAATTIVSGATLSGSVIIVGPDVSVILSGLTIEHGSGTPVTLGSVHLLIGGGILDLGGSVTLSNSVVTQNALTSTSLSPATGIGAGIFALSIPIGIAPTGVATDALATITSNSSVISDNTITATNGNVGLGAGIVNILGVLSMTMSSVTGNVVQTTDGVVAAVGGVVSLGPTTLSGTTISANQALASASIADTSGVIAAAGGALVVSVPLAVFANPPGPSPIATYDQPISISTSSVSGNTAQATVATGSTSSAIAAVGGIALLDLNSILGLLGLTGLGGVPIGATTITDTHVDNNIVSAPTSSAHGGLALIGGGFLLGTLAMQRDTASGNQVTGTQAKIGGLLAIGVGTNTLANSVLSNNTVTATNTTLTGAPAQAFDGGMLMTALPVSATTASSFTLSESTVAGNVVTANGPRSAAGFGGILTTDALTTLELIILAQPRQAPPPPTALTIDKSTISGNQVVDNGDANSAAEAGGFGGISGISTAMPVAIGVSNSTITENTVTGTGGAGGAAGGIAFQANQAGMGPLTLINDTISANTVTAGTGGMGASVVGGGGLLAVGNNAINTQPGVALLTNTIVSGNSANNATGENNCNAATPITDNGGNLESDTSCGFTQASSLNNANPNLGPLQDNGGPQAGVAGDPATATVQTEALLPGSQAINLGLAAPCLAPPINDVDERTLPRYAALRGDCDSGAYDTGGSITPPVTIVGAIPAVVGHAARLGFAASNQPAFAAGYITYLFGGTVFTVRRPITVSCPNHCTGTTSGGVFIAQPGTATLTLSGIVGTGHGLVVPGDKVTLTITIVTTAYPTTHTITKVAISVTTPLGAPVLSDSWSAPFPFATSLILQLM